jgi:rhamnose transport system ATP-binding protein
LQSSSEDVSVGAPGSSSAALSLEGVSKRFGGVQALAGVSLELSAGQVCALLGENGAGKSTAVKILTGVEQPDAGRVLVRGSVVQLDSPRQAWRHGIAVVHQQAALFDELSVAENLFIGHLETRRGGWLDWRSMRQRARASLARLEADFDVAAPLGVLSVGQKHLVAIARALTHEARVLILDEPTAALSQRETEQLFHVVRRLAQAGTAILFISHKLGEVLAIADRYTVFRDGRHVAEGKISDVDEAVLVRAMVGRSITQSFPKAFVQRGAPLLEVRELGNGSDFEAVSFTLHRGEVLGFYGLVGAGRTELMEALFGLTPLTHGVAILEGRRIGRSPRESIEHGLVLVPEDRHENGIFAALSIRENLVLPSLRRLGRGLFPNHEAEAELAEQVSQRLQIKHAGLERAVSELSGGNQQKVVIAKWLATDPKVVILDEPTQGVDVGAKAAVHAFVGELVARGMGVILVSSELPEVMGVADRIAVMHEGRMACLLARAEFDAQLIAAAALGGHPAPEGGGAWQAKGDEAVPLPMESTHAGSARAS